MKRTLFALLGCLLCCASVARASEKIVLGQVAISFYAVTGQVVQAVLERLGHPVELKTGSHSEIFRELGSGGIDLLVAAWLPSAHAVYWEQYGGDAVELTSLYHGARLFWAVPVYVPEAEVASVEDLTKPAVSRRMIKVIRGTKPDSGLMIGSRKIMQSYRLESYGYRLEPGAHLEWQEYFERNYRAGNWFVMPYFRPNFLNRIAEMRRLDEPRGLLGEENDGVMVASKDFVARAPSATIDVLKRMALDLDAVAEMDYMVRMEAMSAHDAARAWMQANSTRVDRWFADK